MSHNRISFSNQELPIKEIENYYNSIEKSLRSFYVDKNDYFTGYTLSELQDELENRLKELYNSTALTMLAAIEAHIRVDFLQRCYKRDRDKLSRAFRDLYKKYGSNIPSLNEILKLWKKSISRPAVVSELRSAFNFRHWLAHGRYWVAKLGKEYDFNTVLTLSIYVQTEFDIDLGA